MVALTERHKTGITQRFKYVQARRYTMLTVRLRLFFHQQSDRVVARYLGTKSATLPYPVWMGGLWGYGELKEQADPLMPNEEDRRLQIVLNPDLRDQYLQAADIASELIGSEAPDPDDPRVRDYLSIAGDRVTQINDVTRNSIQDALVLGGARGYNQHQIAHGVPEDGYVGLDDIVDQTYANRSAAIARTELAFASARATLDTYDESAVDLVEVRDGEGCGWVEHDDPDYPDGVDQLTFPIADALEHPIAHPNCVRVFLPVFE